MQKRELVVLLGGEEAGRLRLDENRQLSFTYDNAWRERDDAVPLSVSMPLAERRHAGDVVGAYLWGLLPNNGLTLEWWGRRFQTSLLSPFGLLARVGQDCAGAVQFVTEERAEKLRARSARMVEWQTDEEVAAHLKRLRENLAAWHAGRATSLFTLSGAQSKTARYGEEGRLGLPRGRTPTTHILKPPIPRFDGHVENEHFCLRLARRLGLATASSDVRRFDDGIAIVIERFDRVRTADLATEAAAAGRGEEAVALRTRTEREPVLRIHQEDLCQALGIDSMHKYEKDGGPSPEDVVRLLRAHSAQPRTDVAAFVDALVFNWLIGGTDAHAKNYALVHQAGGLPRLAPLFDLASALPYPEIDPRRLSLAMAVGGEFRLHGIGRGHWEKLALDLRLDVEATLARAAEVAQRLGPAAERVRDEFVAHGLTHRIVPDLVEKLVTRAADCVKVLARP